MILVDTNVLMDVISGDPVWLRWSRNQLDAAALRDRVAINAVVYAELSGAFTRFEDLDAMLATGDFSVVEIPRPALFLAGQTFQSYRRRGGQRTSLLPDFFIGAHAAVLGAPLITRDAARYRTYYPTVELIVPD